MKQRIIELYQLFEKYKNDMKKEDQKKFLNILHSFSINNLHHKGFGRILTTEVARVKQILKEIDEFEYEYLPDGYVANLETNQMIYTGKFDPNIALLKEKAAEEGILIYIVSEEQEEPSYHNIQ